MDLQLEASALSKTFNRRVIFRDISFHLAPGATLLVTGRNGAGKSTLVKIVAGVLTPSGGSVAFRGPGLSDPARRLAAVGFVAPYLQMYDEFSARENIRLALAIRGMRPRENRIDALLERAGLGPRADDPVRTYSSGMKQRVKYAFALAHDPAVLILDEPMANLDADGQILVRELMREQRREGILIVATNDLSDIDHFDQQVDLNAAR